VFSSLGKLGEAIAANAVRAPAIIVVGEVVRVAHPEAF
jgi:uroporphyrin-III C-methyltransferase/precorrin-2 dehydrogenase/sirohydrochlorin ferrochelatase